MAPRTSRNIVEDIHAIRDKLQNALHKANDELKIVHDLTLERIGPLCMLPFVADMQDVQWTQTEQAQVDELVRAKVEIVKQWEECEKLTAQGARLAKVLDGHWSEILARRMGRAARA